MVKKETPRSHRVYSRSTGSLQNRSPRSPSSDDISLPSIRSTTRGSVRGFNRIGAGSRLTLPAEFQTPGPDYYNIKSTIGESGGPLFKGDRKRSFISAKSSNATFLLPRIVNESPAPGQYEIKSSIGKGHQSSFGTSRRDSRFAGDRNNNAIFLLQKYDDPSPAPTRYSMRSTIGSKRSFNRLSPIPGHSFGKSDRSSRFSGEKNARFLVPKAISHNPGPTAYQTEMYGSFGKSPKGAPFGRSRRSARFPGDHKAVFLLAERVDQFKRPSSFTSFRNP